MNSSKTDDRTLLAADDVNKGWQWPTELRRPTDLRQFMRWIFLATSLQYITISLRSIPAAVHQQSSLSLLHILLMAPALSVLMALNSGMASWTISKGKASAKGWAIGASLIYVLIFLRQFVIPLRPTWDHGLSALFIGVVGLVVFLWPDREVDEMTVSLNTNISDSATNSKIELSAKERRQRWFEVCLVMLVACGGYVFIALYLLINGPRAASQLSSFRAAGGIMQEVTALLVLGYVLSRRGLGFANLGLRWSLSDVGMGLLVTAVSYAAYTMGNTLVQTVHHLMYGSWASGPTAKDFFAHPTVVAIPMILLNPFFEELIVRAYLMTEVIELTGSSMRAVAVSVVVQFSYHLYYGWGGAISLAFFFLPLALYYARSRRALPVIVAHGLLDVYALIRLW
jgi:hypothetical protein